MVYFFGLQSQVRFRKELGFVFVDDGYKIIRLDARIFEVIETGADLLDDMGEVFALRLDSVFQQYETREAAMGSFVGKEI